MVTPAYLGPVRREDASNVRAAVPCFGHGKHEKPPTIDLLEEYVGIWWAFLNIMKHGVYALPVSWVQWSRLPACGIQHRSISSSLTLVGLYRDRTCRSHDTRLLLVQISAIVKDSR